MKKKQFTIKTSNGLNVVGEYEGNEVSKKVIIFSHAFGVGRDSRGLFKKIGEKLKDKYLLVKFDYTTRDRRGNIVVIPFRNHVYKLEAVLKYVKNKFSSEEFNIIAHSLGGVTIGLTSIVKYNKVLLLASLPTSPYTIIKKYFSKRPGSIINESSLSVISRSDGSLIYVQDAFWHQIKKIHPINIYKKLAKNTEVIFVKPLADQVINTNDYEVIRNIDGIKFCEVEGNHEFGGDGNQVLTDLINTLF